MSSALIISSIQTSNKYLNFGFYTYLYSHLNSWDGWRGACCKAKCTHQQLHHESLVAIAASASAKFLHKCTAGKGVCILVTLYSSLNETHSFFFGHFVLSRKEKPMDMATASDEALTLLMYENYWLSWKDRHKNKIIVRPLRYMKQEGMCYGEWKYQEN
jgi:hypothetical protein